MNFQRLYKLHIKLVEIINLANGFTYRTNIYLYIFTHKQARLE